MIAYLITDPTHSYTSFAGADFVCYRDKEKKNFRQEATYFLSQARQASISHVFLNEDYLLAKELGFDGVHLTSRQFVFIPEAQRRGLKVIISCHTEAEIEEAIRKKVDFVTYSPIFETPNKGEAKGIENLKTMVDRYNIPIIALGGILTEEQIKAVKEAGAYGFASIRYFIR